ncbi:MAG: hypothetical protein RLZZ367_721 [Bacteroidota bacterium]|jgi:hypothetical protein
MNYLVEIKNGPESKPLFDYLRTLKYVKVIYENKGTYHFTEEEMALPMRKKPTKSEPNEFLDRKQGKRRWCKNSS